MVLKRYQVFVSSTYEDLKIERRELLQAFEETNRIPAGMEFFSASDRKSWPQIQKSLEESDYYVIVVAGRYGVAQSSGVSFTEAEYDYATALGLPRLVFIHHNPNKISLEFSENSRLGRARLSKFIKKLQDNHHRDVFTSPENLKYKVVRALEQEIERSPRPGWLRNVVGVEDLGLQLSMINSQLERINTRIVDRSSKPDGNS